MGIISYAQNFEDVLLWRVLGDIENGFYIDIGAQHPDIDSVSRAFYDAGWRGVHVEPVHKYADLLRSARPDETVFELALDDHAGHAKFFEIENTGLSTLTKEVAEYHRSQGQLVTEVDVELSTLDEIFSRVGARDIHWMKVDVEGHEREVLLGWRENSSRPWVVVVEATFPNSTRETHADWENLVLAKGYILAYKDGLNRYYLSASKIDLLERMKNAPNVFDGYQLAPTSWSVGHALSIERYRLSELTKNNSILAAENAGLRTELAALRDESIGLYESIQAQANVEIRRIQEDYSSKLENLGQRSEAEKSDLARQLEEAVQARAAITLEARAESERLSSEIGAITLALQRLSEQKQNDEAVWIASNEALMAELEVLRSEHESKVCSLTDHFNAHIEKLKTDHHIEESKLSQALAEERLRNSEVRSALLEKLNAISEEHEKQIAEFTGKIQALDQIIINNVERHSSEQSELRDQFTTRISELTASIASDRASFDRREQIVKAQHHRELAQLRAQLSDSEKSCRRLSDSHQMQIDRIRLEHRDELDAVDQRWHRQISSVQDDFKALIGQRIEEENSRARDAGQSIKAMEAESQRLHGVIEEIVRTANEREKYFNDKVNSTEKYLQEELASAISAHKIEIHRRDEEHRADNEKQDQKIASLTVALQSLSDENHQLELKVGTLTTLQISDKQSIVDLQYRETRLLSMLALQTERLSYLCGLLANVERSFGWRVAHALRESISILWPLEYRLSHKIDFTRWQNSILLDLLALNINLDNKNNGQNLPRRLASSGPLERLSKAAMYMQKDLHSKEGRTGVSHEKSMAITNISDLLRLTGFNFVRETYIALLHREPDRSGVEHYLAALRRGDSREDVVAQIALSKEAINIKQELLGLDQVVRRYQDRNHWLKGIFIRIRDAQRSLNRLEYLVDVESGKVNQPFEHNYGNDSKSHNESLDSELDVRYKAELPDPGLNSSGESTQQNYVLASGLDAQIKSATDKLPGNFNPDAFLDDAPNSTPLERMGRSTNRRRFK